MLKTQKYQMSLLRQIPACGEVRHYGRRVWRKLASTSRMRDVFLLFLILLFGCAGPSIPTNGQPLPENLVLARDGKTDYVIVISGMASPSENHAAMELQKFLKEISGVTLPVITDNQALTPNEIILGDNNRLKQLGLAIDFAKLGLEGFAIRTHRNHLVIAGGKPRGTLYGVYTFLEDYLNCRWFSSRVSRIPENHVLKIPLINETQVPVFEYREDFYTDAFDPDWAVRNKMNSSRAELDKKRGGKIVYAPSLGHTFYTFLPPEEYFKEHPEYYSEQKGQRFYEGGQLCLTNPEVINLVIAKVKEVIRQNPEVNIIPVSQNDWGGWCECENCRALDQAEGSYSGTIINFVNQIAQGIEKEYPQIAIDTFAYQYSRRPPKTIKPRANVIVRLCSIECCFSHPLESCPENDSFADDLEGWSRICQRLYVWDYVTNFAHYLMPFPNFKSLGPNIKFFAAHNVKGVFEEGNYSAGGCGEFAELRAYVIAKLLWNPNYNVDQAVTEFMETYYGQSAPAIFQYFNLMHDQVTQENIHLGIFDPPILPYLSGEMLKRANQCFDEAEKIASAPASALGGAGRGEQEILKRVKIARLPLMYVAIVTAPDNKPDPQLVSEFFTRCESSGLTNVGEWANKTIEVFRQNLEQPRPFLGANLRHLNPDGTEGVFIENVRSGWPADRAGLQAGDIIIEVNHRAVGDVNGLIKIIREYQVGDQLKIKIKRAPPLTGQAEQMIELSVTLGPAPLY
ncbi:MAG: DUF4838 domain-containing protein [Planctomycetota bacterium]